MGAVRLVVGCDLRRRWRRVVLLAMLIGLVGGTSMSVAAGARRTGTALTRFRRSSGAADLEIDGGAPTVGQRRALERIPQVAAIGSLDAYGLVLPIAPDFEAIGSPAGPAFGRTVDRDRIVAGREPTPAAVDEVTVGEGFARQHHVDVGDRLAAMSLTPGQVAQLLRGDKPGLFAGPRLQLRVVGIVRRAADLGDEGAAGGFVVLTPAFARAEAGKIGVFGQRLRIRTVHGASDVNRVLASARQILGPWSSARRY